MAAAKTPIPFSLFPEDIQLKILSFLLPTDLSSFASTCRQFAALCSLSSPSPALWLALCDRRWGSQTLIPRWAPAPSPFLYQTLTRWENLIGFWRRIDSCAPTLLSFEWLPSSIAAFRISPSPSSIEVHKIPFLWLSLSAAGETLSYLDPGSVPVTVSFMGGSHLVIQERQGWEDLNGEGEGLAVPEMYEYFANRAGPGRERRRKEKERIREKRWKAVLFVKISNWFPTTIRPLQGLWKVIMQPLLLVVPSCRNSCA